MRFSARRSSTIRLATALAVFAAAGCGGDSNSSGPSDGTEVESFLSQVATADLQTTATLREGERPGAQGSGTTLTIANTAAAILGGSSQVGLQSSTGFSRVIVAVEGETGYYELTLPAAVTSTQVVITLPQELPRSTFNVLYGIADAAGAVAAYESAPVTVQTVGTGDVQVSISWDAESDVDLHVVEPANGEDIYYGNPASASGGQLDLDSNAGCQIDGVKNENVTFPTGQAPRGEYIVRVDYWSNCDVPQTKYVVTVRVAGRAPQTFTGTLTGEGDQGAEGSGTEVARFTY